MRLFPIRNAGMLKLASLLVVFGFMFPLVAEATNYNPTDIGISFKIDPPFYRVAKDADLTITTTVTLNKPNSLDLGYVSNDGLIRTDPGVFGKYSADRITGFTVGALNTAKVDTYCKVLPGYAGGGYKDCRLDYRADPLRSTAMAAGTSYPFKIVLTPANREALGLNQASDSGTLNQVTIIPQMLLATIAVGGDSTTGNFDVSFLDSAQKLSIQVYNTDAQVQQDKNNAPPAGAVVASSTKTSDLSNSVNQSQLGILGLINKILAAILTLILQIIYSLFWFVIVPLLQSILSIRTYKDSFANVIYPGWEIIRNICNIAFVVAMLWMGLSQIFGFDSFNYKKGLGKLVIAALLVNFSLIIPQTILAVSETVQNQFLPNNTKVINALGYKLMVEPMEKLAIGSSTVDTLSVGSINNFGSTAKIFLYFCMAVAAFFVFAAIMFNLLIRLIGLWALLLTSPVGFAGGVLPFTQSFQKQWWKYFICYATYTPVVAFMLNLTALMTDRISQGLNSAAIPNFSNSVSPGISSFVFTLLPNFLLLGFMYATISVAKMACGFAPVDKLTSKFGGRALDLASTSMSGRPDKAFVGGVGDIAKATGVSTVRDFASRQMAAAGWHEGGEGYWAKSKKQIYTTLNADRVAKRAWDRYYKEPLAEKDKKQKEAIEGMFQTYKKAGKFANDAKNESKELYSGYALDDVASFNKLAGKTDIKSKLKRAGLLLHAMDDPDNADAFLKGIGYSTNAEGVLKMLNKEVAAGTITQDQANEIQKRFDRSFSSKKMYNKGFLRNPKDGKLRTLADLDTIKQEQNKQFQLISDSTKGEFLTKAGGPVFVEQDEKGVMQLNNIAVEHIAHSQDANRAHDLVNASKLRPADKESLENINKDPALRDSAINSILATNPTMGKPQAEKLWDDYYQASKKKPPAKGAKGGKGKKGGGGGGGGVTPTPITPTPPTGGGTPPPTGGAGTPPVTPTTPPAGPAGAAPSSVGSAPSPAGTPGSGTSTGSSTSSAGPSTGSYTPPAPSTPATPTPPAAPSSPSTPPTPPAASSSSSKPKVIFGPPPITNLQNPQGSQTPPVPSNVAPPTNDVVKNYTGFDAVEKRINSFSSGPVSDPILSGIGQTEKQVLVQGISSEMNNFHNALSQSSGQNFIALQQQLHESLAQQIIKAKGLDPQDPKIQSDALASAKNVTKNYMKDVHNI